MACCLNVYILGLEEPRQQEIDTGQSTEMFGLESVSVCKTKPVFICLCPKLWTP